MFILDSIAVALMICAAGTSTHIELLMCLSRMLWQNIVIIKTKGHRGDAKPNRKKAVSDRRRYIARDWRYMFLPSEEGPCCESSWASRMCNVCVCVCWARCESWWDYMLFAFAHREKQLWYCSKTTTTRVKWCQAPHNIIKLRVNENKYKYGPDHQEKGVRL